MPPKDTIRVILTNRKAVFVQPYDSDAIKKHFAFQPSGYEFSPKYKMGIWNGWISLFRRGGVGTGLFFAKRAEIEQKEKVEFVITDRRTPCLFKPLDLAKFTDRQYQKECIEAMVAASNTGGLVLMGTGTGKTRTAAIYLAHLRGKGCFVVDELTLLDQARTEIAEVTGEEIGIIGKGEFIPKRITVATVQTLAKHFNDKRFKMWHKALDVMLVDEWHVHLNRRNFDTVKAMCPKAVFGLTASLQMDVPKVALESLNTAGPVVYEYSLQTGTKEGVLKPGVVVCCDIVRSTGLTSGMADHAAKYTKWIVRSRQRNNVVEALIREAVRRGLRTIVLGERIQHIKIIDKRIHDIPHGLVYGPIKTEERKDMVQRFEANTLKVIVSSRVFKKAINIRNVGCVIDVAAGQSQNDAIQKFGRGKRTGDYANLIYIDVGDCAEQGFSNSKKYGNFAEVAAILRRKGFSKTGIPMKKVIWAGDPKLVFDTAVKALKR